MDTLFPLQEAFHYLASAFAGVERNDLALRWPDGDGITELRVEPTGYKTHDGLTVREVVTLAHTVPGLRVTPRQAGMLNRWATLSALVPGFGDDEPARFVCKVGIFEDDRDAAERVYAPLLCSEAGIIGWHVARVLRGQLQMDPALSPLSHVTDPTPYDAASFSAAKAVTDLHGVMATLEDGLTAEFPWQDGAVSSMFAWPDVRARLLERGGATAEELDRMAGPTSMLQIVTDQPHALYGNGVLARFELPVPCDEQTGPVLVDELNRWELSGVDLPPQFGAWCVGPRAPTFVTFIPNQLCAGIPDLLRKLTIWTSVRNARVRQWLSAAGRMS